VSVIDAKAMKQVALIPVGEVPKRISTLVLPESQLANDESPARSAQSQDGSTSPTLDYDFFKSRVEPIFLKSRSEEHARCYACHEKYKHPSGFHLEPLSPGASFWTEDQSRINFQTLSNLVNIGHPLQSIFPS